MPFIKGTPKSTTSKSKKDDGSFDLEQQFILRMPPVSCTMQLNIQTDTKQSSNPEPRVMLMHFSLFEYYMHSSILCTFATV